MNAMHTRIALASRFVSFSVRDSFAFLLCCAPSSLMGCTTLQAPVDRTIGRGEFSAHVERAAARQGKEVRLALVLKRVPAGTKLLRAYASGEGWIYCSGPQAAKLSRSAAPTASDPLRSDERVVLEFPAEALDRLVGPAPRVDLLVESARGTHRCMPLELTENDQKLEWDYDQRFTVGLDMAVEGYTNPLGPFSRLVPFEGTLGLWLGRYRLELGAGVGGAGCDEKYCVVEEKDSSIDYKTVYPMHAGVQTALWEKGEYSFGVSARYRAVKLLADTRTGRESAWTHGPLVVPYLGAALPVVKGTSLGGSRGALIGFELPLGFAMAENGKRSLSIGIGMRSFFTAF